MDKRIKELFNDDILKEAAKRYDVPFDSIESIGGFESFVYKFNQKDKDYIMRISHSIHRDINMIKGELDWVNYLHDNGVSVSRAVKSQNQEYVEKIDIGESYFIAVVFEKAKGRHMSKEDACETLYKNWGQEIGKLHSVTKNYKPYSESIRRPFWDEEYLELINYIPSSQEKIIENAKNLYSYTDKLPKDIDSYGLIHTDAHFGNFFIDNNKITLFDFDDSTYKWFASDIAIPLFYALNPKHGKENEEFARKFMSNFLEGYYKENNLGEDWIREIPTFLKMREIVLYAVIHRSFDVNNLKGWVEIFMNNRKNRIENNIPYVDIDFSKL